MRILFEIWVCRLRLFAETASVFCFEVLVQISLKPSKLKRNLQTKHPELVYEDLSFFQRMIEDIHKSGIESTYIAMSKGEYYYS